MAGHSGKDARSGNVVETFAQGRLCAREQVARRLAAHFGRFEIALRLEDAGVDDRLTGATQELLGFGRGHGRVPHRWLRNAIKAPECGAFMGAM